MEEGSWEGYFFFQAEDGIRGSPVMEFRRVLFRSPHRLREVAGIGPKRVERILEHWGRDRAQREIAVMLRGHGLGAAITQIGRASCRERA